MEKEPKFEKPKTISEIRKQKLLEAMERMKEELPEKELALIKAILLFGSTARGTATEKSDIDIYIVPDEKTSFNSDTVKKIMKIIEEGMPDEEIQYGLRPIVSPEGRPAKFLRRKNPRHPEEEPIHEFLYSKNPEIKVEIDDTLKKVQQGYDK